MIIDKKGRLFGKLSIIDLAIVLVIVVVGVFIFRRFVSNGILKQDKEILVTYYSEDTLDFVVDAIQTGDKIEDEGKNLDMGLVSDIEKHPGFYYVTDDQGVMKKSMREGITNLILTGVARGQMFENGLIINGNKYNVGQGLTIRAGKAKVFMRISAIEEKK